MSTLPSIIISYPNDTYYNVLYEDIYVYVMHCINNALYHTIYDGIKYETSY